MLLLHTSVFLLIDRRNSLYWLFRKTSRDQDNPISQVHAWAGIFCHSCDYQPLVDLTFLFEQIYSAEVSVFLGGNKPSRTADLRGDISVNFSCDPEISSKLVRSLFSHNPTTLYLSVIAAIWFYQSHLFVFQVDLALEEIVRLQEEGPSQEDISAILEIEQRAHENGLQVWFFCFFAL